MVFMPNITTNHAITYTYHIIIFITTVKRREEEPRMNLLAEIRHFNTPKYKNQFSLENLTGFICVVGLHFPKHFEQKSGFNMGNLYYII